MDTNILLLAALVGVPVLAAALCLAIPAKGVRNALVLLTFLLMTAAALVLAGAVQAAGGTLEIPLDESVTQRAGLAILGVDLIVLCYVIARGIAARRWIAPACAVLQLIALVIFEMTGHHGGHGAPIIIDGLSLVLVLLVSIIGPIILVYAMGYMQLHEDHLHLTRTRQPRFFAILFLFLGVMNGLAIAESLPWIYTFWEVTTLCSFLLIAHDGTEEARRNAFRTLEINMFGGVAFIAGILTLSYALGTVAIHEIVTYPLRGAIGWLPLGIALLCVAGFTKAAQFPFQSWLLGAMVAPTPVSALLHSSTMVKAGVFLIVRLAPMLAGSVLGTVVAVAGGFTFLAASAIAISQRNGKRVLAYSTIANLGLVVCCAGIGTQAAVGAAILLMIFHALSKGLLFLCIGTIEQRIGSRDIEDMQGLMKLMPFTTFVTVLGMISMLLPPFGVLLTKWIAIESSIHVPLVLVMIILGSAFTVVVWAKWIGIILTMSYKPKYRLEKLRSSMSVTLGLLLLGVLVASFGIGPLTARLVVPHLLTAGLDSSQTLAAHLDGLSLNQSVNGLVGGAEELVGMVQTVPLFLLVLLLVVALPLLWIRVKPERVKPPYFGGDLANNDIRGIDFYGPGDKVEQIVVHNYYLASKFGEEKLTLCMNLLAIAVICVMFGVVVR